MRLPKSKIEYATHCFNPVVGCKRGCPYCYSKRLNDRFKIIPDFTEPKFFPERLSQPVKTKKPGVVVVGFQGDLFAEWIPYSWIEDTFYACQQAPQHQYLFLTKNPDRYLALEEVRRPDNWYLGITIDKLSCFHLKAPYLDWISFEPLLEDVADEVNFEGLKWVVIGGKTQPLRQPKKVWVDKILKRCDKHNIPVWMKDSLEGMGMYPNLRKETPWKE